MGREGGRCVKEGIDRLLMNGIDDERSAIAGNARHPGGEAAGSRQDVWADERGRGVARSQAGGEAVRAERRDAQSAATECSQPADRGSRMGLCYQCVQAKSVRPATA